MIDPKPTLDRIRFFDVEEDLNALSENEREALTHCVRAAEIMTEVYREQFDPRIKDIKKKLAADTSEGAQTALAYLNVQGGPWDAFNEDRSFVDGVGSRPEGIALYPSDMTKKEWDDWLSAHPEERGAFESPYTKIVRDSDALKAVPYSEAYREPLERAARELERAAGKLDAGPFQTFLKSRAHAFLSNEYRESDMEWIDTNGEPFEVTIGPYEVYADQLLSYKAMFEAFIALPDAEATKELQKFAAHVPEFDAGLSRRFGYVPKGGAIPLEVVRDVYRGGEAAFGRMFVAYNLPNDRKIHELKGSKKVFSRTMMEAKFSLVGHAFAERVLKPEDLKHYQFRNRLLFVLCHELGHGLGPGVRMIDGREVSFEILLRELHSTLEEAKADMLGISLLNHFSKKGLVSEEELVGAVATEVVAFVQGWVASYTEAHAQGSLIEYNWLKEHGAVSFDVKNGVFDIDVEKSLIAMMALGDEFMNVQFEGNYDNAKAFMEHWAHVPPEIPPLVESLKDLPLEVHPVFKV